MINIFTVYETEMKVKRPIDDQLIIDIADGNTDALHTLYEATSESVYGFALSITKNSHDAEDVLQETYLAVFQKAVNYNPAGKPMAWVFTIAKNFALAKLKAKGKVHLLDDGDTELGVTFSQIENIEQRLVIETAFRVLNDEERQILMLHAISGLKHREIASIMEMSLNTVLSKYHRAIKKMRSELAQEEMR